MGVDDGWHRVGTDPFAMDRPEDVVRRLRGRLAAPVTVWTAYRSDGTPAGITVSSLMVAEGEPASVLGLVGPLSDFWEAAVQTRRFVVQVLDASATATADRFALRYPGDPFEGLSLSPTEWGPVLGLPGTRALCSLGTFLEVGYQLLVRGSVDHVVAAAAEPPPLVHYRGSYLTVAPRR